MASSTASEAPAQDVRSALERILASPLFGQSERQRQLLNYIVERRLDGAQRELNQFAIGIDVFGRDGSFDPTIDAIVRVEVGRLRARLREYYEAFPDEPVVIRVPKGRYVPEFDVISPPPSGSTTRAAAHLPVIAVLPFQALGDDAADGYFADGICDDLITDLSKLSGLRVIARSSSFVYRGTDVAAAKVGRELGADYQLEGSVRRAGGRLRINAQLVECAGGEHVWAERYDRELSDVFAVQDEVGRRIVAALSIAVSAVDQYRRDGIGTVNLEAYDAVLRAAALSWAPADIDKACALYDRAIALDPDYATAHARKANLMWYQWRTGRASSAMLDAALATAEKAIELDPEYGEAHAVAGFTRFWQGDVDGATACFDRALTLDPNNVRILERVVIALALEGRTSAATAHLERACTLNPHEPYFYPRALIAFSDGRLDEAITLLRGGAERFESFLPTRVFLAAALALTGDIIGARAEIAIVRHLGSAKNAAEVLAGYPPSEMSAGMRRLRDGIMRAWSGPDAV